MNNQMLSVTGIRSDRSKPGSVRCYAMRYTRRNKSEWDASRRSNNMHGHGHNRLPERFGSLTVEGI